MNQMSQSEKCPRRCCEDENMSAGQFTQTTKEEETEYKKSETRRKTNFSKSLIYLLGLGV